MPLIKEFDKYFVRGRDVYGRARYYDFRMEEFAELCSDMVLPNPRPTRM